MKQTSLLICLVLLEYLSVKIAFYSRTCEANRDAADAEFPFPLFFSFSASFKNPSPWEKVGKLSSFWDWWTESLFVPIIVAKYNILPRANDGRSREKKYLAKRFAHAISHWSVHYQDLELAYVYWIWWRGSASYVINRVGCKKHSRSNTIIINASLLSPFKLLNRENLFLLSLYLFDLQPLRHQCM